VFAANEAHRFARLLEEHHSEVLRSCEDDVLVQVFDVSGEPFDCIELFLPSILASTDFQHLITALLIDEALVEQPDVLELIDVCG